MGIEDFLSEEQYSFGSIKTRKKMENVTVSKEAWARALAHNPHITLTFITGMDETGIKATIQMFDEVLEGELDFEMGELSDETREELKDVRTQIIEENLDEQ
jgi:hypothetical protein